MAASSFHDAILLAWNEQPPAIRYDPANEQQLCDFESEFEAIPAEFRWFLKECGGGVVGSEWIDGIDKLGESHRKFRNESGPGGWTIRDAFLIGWDGAGNPMAIDRISGRVIVEDHNFGGVHELASSFSVFLANGLDVDSKQRFSV